MRCVCRYASVGAVLAVLAAPSCKGGAGSGSDQVGGGGQAGGGEAGTASSGAGRGGSGKGGNTTAGQGGDNSGAGGQTPDAAVASSGGRDAGVADALKGAGGTDAGGKADGPVSPSSPCGPVGTDFPSATNTGVPAGTTLKASASITVSKAGTVIDGMDIAGCVTVSANNVTIRRSRIKTSGTSCAMWDSTRDHTGIVIEDTEIDGSGGVNSMALWCANCSLCRVKMHDVVEGIRAIHDVTMQDSYVYNIASAAMNDDSGTANVSSNIVVRHNTIEDGPLPTDDNSRAWHGLIEISPSHGPPSGILIEKNLLAGGAWAVIIDKTLLDVRVLDNRLSRKFYPNCGKSGAIQAPGTVTGNVWHETGLPYP